MKKKGEEALGTGRKVDSGIKRKEKELAEALKKRQTENREALEKQLSPAKPRRKKKSARPVKVTQAVAGW